MGRFATAWNAFWKILGSGQAAEQWREFSRLREKELPEASPPTESPAEVPPEKAHADAVYTLALLQREGRLIDFLQEDISAYADAQVGAAVRQIHAGCRKALDEYFGIQPLLEAEEGGPYEVPEGFDPRHIRVTGNAAGAPPFRGTLRHKGWKAGRVKLPERHEQADPSVVCPAEVEV